MRRVVHILSCLWGVVMPFLVAGCSGESADATAGVDSLNMMAYRMRYVSMDSTERLAHRAFALSEPNSKGRADALANLAFVKYMKMEYDSAFVLYTRSHDESDDMVTRMAASVGLMKICQVTSQNKEFYDYSIRAREEGGNNENDNENENYNDGSTGSPTIYDLMKLNYARSEFYMASATFLSDMMQDGEARECFKVVRDNYDWIREDTAQMVRYLQLCGMMGQGSVDNDMKVQYITDAFVLARQRNLVYMQAGSMQQMASFLIDNPDGLRKVRAFKVLLGVEDVDDDCLGIVLADRALGLYKEYGSHYGWALSYLTISKHYLQNNQPEVALDSAMKAVDLALTDRKKDPDKHGEPWEWAAKIHEFMSIVYGSLGDKEASDRHRNRYLDILEQTRQDRMYEQRRDMLEKDKTELRWLLTAVYMVGGVVLVLAIVFFFIIKRRQAEKHARMRELMEEEKAVLGLRLKKNKRNYIDKCATLSIVNGIRPFLSRAIRVLNNVRGENDLKYVRELFGKINEYNDILTHWIKMKQGEVKLHVEIFELQPLFDVLAKNRNVYDQKGIDLIINDTDLSVKADRALTMFMMNTLLDNARKFTDRGHVELSAEEGDNYVEISVSDTGCGVESVNDSRKGFGFGLMNCRGIIEKYRKTSRLFDVCQFDVESKIGEGSKFRFRLPKGTKKAVMCLMLLMVTSVGGLAQVQKPGSGRLLDMKIPEDSLLIVAHEFADSAFYANVDGNYAGTYVFADSVLRYLNKYYEKMNPEGSKLMVLNGGRYKPEIDLWNEGFVTDYVSVLDIRNELAIAALAMKDMAMYKYNNDVYARLYKLCGQDHSLEEYCKVLDETNRNTKAAIFEVVALIIIGIVVFVLAQRYLARLANSLNDEENRKIEYEDNIRHVQNMILDNCLSTIKHETMYYPSRIINLTEAGEGGAVDVKGACELAIYYEEVLGVLTEHAMKQLENVQFRRKKIKAVDLVGYFNDGSLRQARESAQDKHGSPTNHNENENHKNVCVIGDEAMLHYLIDSLTGLGKEHGSGKDDMKFYFEMSEGFVKFAFDDRNMELSDEEMDGLFYPDNLKYDAVNDRLIGTQYLVCKQIIREHDEHCGRRGCRIYAERGECGGRIVFTLPEYEL